MDREEIHKLPWKAQEYINELERKLTLNDVRNRSGILIAYELRNIEHPDIVDKEVAKKQVQEYLSNLMSYNNKITTN